MGQPLKTVAFAFVMAAGVTVLTAGTTGKIQGTVKDKKTGEALVGVNVVLQGTQQGAATDWEGYYFISNIPPGTYTVVFSMIGYRTTEVHEVKVWIDRTTDVHVQLEETAVEMEAVVVQAERPIVQPEITNKAISVTSEEIETMPIRESQDVLKLQAGVTQVEGSFNKVAGFEARGIDQTHVRGGRSGEIAYMVDGMYVEDAVYAGMGTFVNRAAIEEMKVEVGGFNAEYGEAQAAVVNIVTKEGRSAFHGSLEASGSGWADVDGTGKGFRPISTPDALRDYHDVLASFGGPVPLIPGLSFFFSGEQRFNRYSILEFDDITYDSTLITDPNDPNFGKRVGDTTYVFAYGKDRRAHPYDSFAGWKAFGFDDKWDYSIKLTYRPFAGIKINLLHRTAQRQFRNYENTWRFAEKVRHITTDLTSQQGLTWNHTLSTNTYYTLNFNRFWKDRYYRTPGLHGDEFGPGLNASDYDHDGMGPSEDSDELWHYISDRPDHPSPRSLGGFWQPLRTVGFDSTRGVWVYSGGLMRYWHRDFQQSYGIKGDLTSQLSRRHEIKTGFEFRQYDIYFREIQLPYLESPYADNYFEHPQEGSAYLQDAINLDRVIINMGTRFDYADSRGALWEDPKDPTTRVVRGRRKWQFSPRVGFGYSITDRTAFHFNYGHFFQVPSYRDLYVGAATRDLSTPLPLIGNPHMKAERTVQYEFGIKQQVGMVWGIDVTAWTKSITGLSGTVNIIGFDPDSLGLYSYYNFDNYDHGTSRGIDVTVEKRFSHYFMGKLNYTFSVAKANRYYSWTGYWNQETEETEPKRELLMPYDQTHVMDAWLYVQLPDRFGPEVAGIRPLELWSFSFIFSYQSGYPYTPVTGSRLTGEPMSARTPARFRVDADIQRSFWVYGMKLGLFARVLNLLDRLNPLTVYSSTGSPTEPDPVSSGYSTQFDRPDFFDIRRQIDLGVRLEF
ncbi:MAG: TonB-dependent receptor domain-containing protein [Fidelibacterota bacterium]